MGKLFGTDGVRGIVNKDLTPELAFNLASSICETFGKGSTFLIGRDVRLGGEVLFSAIISGLTSTGCQPYDGGLAPTPAIQYNIRKNDMFDGGIIITASHNPPMYNGIKVIDADGIEVSREKEKEIEEVFFSARYSYVSWSKANISLKKYPGLIDEYLNGIIVHIDSEIIKRKSPKVVIDCANSVGSLVIPQLVRMLGGKPLSLNAHLDPYFPGREPEPTPDSLVVASKLVLESKASFGVGTDGDADRSIFIDDHGNIHWGDKTAIVLAPFLKEKNPQSPPRVYTGVSSSYLIEDLLKEYGIEIVWMKVGSVDISRRLVKEGGLFGFEENGGTMYPPHQPVRDAAMTVALMLELISKSSIPLSQLYSVYPHTYTIKTKYPIERSISQKIINKLENEYSSYKKITIDGIKVLLDDGWFLVRPSGTEPVLRVMIEMKTKEGAQRLLARIEKIINEVARK